MNSGTIGNNRLPLDMSSLQFSVSQSSSTPIMQTIFSLSRSPFITTIATSTSTLLFNTPTTALTPMYETSFALPGCDQTDKLFCNSGAQKTTGLSIISTGEEGHPESLQRATILTPVEKSVNGALILTTLPATNSNTNNVGELCNNSGLIESHLLQMAPILPMTTISATSTPSIEMMDWSTQPTSKTVMHFDLFGGKKHKVDKNH